MSERKAGCHANTQVFSVFKHGNFTCLVTFADDGSIRRGASKGHMSAPGVFDGKVPRDRPVIYIDGILLKRVWIVGRPNFEVISVRKRTTSDDIH